MFTCSLIQLRSYSQYIYMISNIIILIIYDDYINMATHIMDVFNSS